MTRNNRDIMMRILTRRVRPALRAIIEARFERAKEIFLDEVRDHEISKYINSHGPCPLLGGSVTGTLFGFIGFEEGSDPVGDLIDFLEENITFVPNNTAVNKLFSSSVHYPSKAAFESEQFHLVWIDRGWPNMIEEGVSGLQYYINRPSGNSISGEGIEAKAAVRGGDFGHHDYLTQLFANFRKNLLLK